MDLKTVIDSVKDLSPTPKILPKLQDMLRDPESGIEDVIGLLKVDAPLTAQIVRLSNSAAFAFTAPNTDLEGAVSCLGFQEVYKVVGVVATGQVLGRATPVYKLETGELWENSLKTAVIIDALAKRVKLDPNTAYTMGLLHTIGKVVINSFYMDKGIEIYSDEDEDSFIPDLERQLIGFDHAQASAALLRKWSFPEESCSPIENYPYPLEATDYRDRACLLHLASIVTHVLKQDVDVRSLRLGVPEQILEAACIDEFNFRDALQEAQGNLKAVQEFMAA